MNPNESTAFLRSDEDDPDFLRDKPMGRCPWCHVEIENVKTGNGAWFPTRHWKMNKAQHDLCRWDISESELDNRARYQQERMEEARVQERVNREVRRSGREDSY